MEFGIITTQGPHKILALIREIQAGEVTGLPRIAISVVECLAAQLDNLAGEIRNLEIRQIVSASQAPMGALKELLPFEEGGAEDDAAAVERMKRELSRLCGRVTFERSTLASNNFPVFSHDARWSVGELHG